MQQQEKEALNKMIEEAIESFAQEGLTIDEREALQAIVSDYLGKAIRFEDN